MTSTVHVFEVPSCAFQVLGIIGQGAYGAVCEASRNGQKYAIKKIPAYDKTPEQATKVLRELIILKHLQPVNQVVGCHLVFRPNSDSKDVYLVMELAQSDLSTMMKKSEATLKEDVIQYIVAQLLLGIRAVHRCGCIHRDLSTRNVLVGEHCKVHLCDFGLARHYDPDERQSFGVVTQWYRSPEIILDAKYDEKADVWAVGVIMAELFLRTHLFPAKVNDLADQIQRILKVVGTPNFALFTDPAHPLSTASENAKQFMSRFCQNCRLPNRLLDAPFKVPPSSDAKSLLLKLLTFDPVGRVSAEDALKHAWFNPLREFIDDELDHQNKEVGPLENSLFTQAKTLPQLCEAIERMAPKVTTQLLSTLDCPPEGEEPAPANSSEVMGTAEAAPKPASEEPK